MKTTTRPIMILGATGNFGKLIADSLAKAQISLILVARQLTNLQQLHKKLQQQYKNTALQYVAGQAPDDLASLLQQYQPIMLINASGPFQGENYAVALCCINAGVDYVDLADARDFVVGIKKLDAQAKAAAVSVIAGASTVPALSSAIIEHDLAYFSQIYSLRYGIATGAKTPRGLATTKAILKTIGRPLKPSDSKQKTRYGWQNTYRQYYPKLGYRWMGNCDIPDLDLFPQRYGIKQINFSAGMQSSLLHFGIWGCSWLVRLMPFIHFDKYAKPLLRFSHAFDCFGNAASGMHLILQGQDTNGNKLERRWFITACGGDGIRIPTVPAVLIGKRIAQGQRYPAGAQPCVGLIRLEDYAQELQGLDIKIELDDAEQ